MATSNRYRLIAGPYRAPRVELGDRTKCLHRGCTVMITRWSDARISWPLCRSLRNPGLWGLLVEKELQRAIRNESVMAMAYWFGVSPVTVCRWRKALGVTRKNNPGTVRLNRAALRKGWAKRDAALRTRVYTKRERAKCRARSIRLQSGNYLLSFHGRRLWTPNELRLFKSMTNQQIARRTGRTLRAVWAMRHKVKKGLGKWRL